MTEDGGARFAAPLCVLTAALWVGCSGVERPPASAPPVSGRLFTLLPSSYTGVRFENRLNDTRDLNVFTYRNYYNGGGVALGDLSGDGLPEIVLSSNQGGVQLYLNEGKFQFRDVTAEAGLKSTKPWTTGVTIADVNGDGLLDLYVCHAGKADPAQRANELFINQGLDARGVPTFKEMAASYGIADEGWTTHAAFFDYDKDGSLDLFVVNNSPRPVVTMGEQNTRAVRDSFGGDKLYHNVRGHFEDVSAPAGVYGSEIGLGLGVAVSDFNRDGWPDLYVSNDFFERDYLYLNNGNGTFREVQEQEMPSTSYASMGLDAADIDNDGWPDLFVVDMLPEDEYRLKTMASFETWEQQQANVLKGFNHQYTRDVLQRNNGNGTFSEIGQMAGVASTDWSWSALIADLDLDGRKDLYVTNGIARDLTAQDYLSFLANDQTMRDAMRGKHVDFLGLIGKMTSTPLVHYAFRNEGDYRFSNQTAAWGLAQPSFGNGAAYGDLDGDGAPDLVVNNINQEAFIYRNNARTVLPENHYLQVKLEGEGPNRFAIGAKVAVETSGQTLYQEEEPSRGFQSSVDYVLTFGLGKVDTVRSVAVEWPDGRVSTLNNVAANQRLVIGQGSATRPPSPEEPAPSAARGRGGKGARPAVPMLMDVTNQVALPFVHKEDAFDDFNREPLIPKLVSIDGPDLAVADVNNDGLDDIFIGGAKYQAGALLIQQPNGRFVRSNPGLFELDSISEDLGAVFFDANGDGRPDLYVVSGGNEFSPMTPPLQDRLYLNDGHGRFHKAAGALPTEDVSGSPVAATDFDGDGDIDLFVGGRVVPWHYGADPRSMLLQNDGHGHFTDVTARLAPDLVHAGMVTDAVWRDVDGDGRPDLIVVGEWMPITIFHNAGGGRLVRQATRGLEQSSGWWNRIVAGDFTGHGRVDFIAGNLGLNTRFQATVTEPVTMYVKDFAGNGTDQQILSVYNHGVSYPLELRDDFLKAIPSLRLRYLTYKDYARQTVKDIFTSAQLQGAIFKQGQTFGSALVRNNGDGSFTLVPLPREAQIAPIYAVLPQDVDGDGKTDLLVAGNFEGVKPEIGRMSAGYGLLLRGNGNGDYVPLEVQQSGFSVPGQARDIKRVRTRTGFIYVVSRNNDAPLVFRTARAH
ncbi:MAG TPA: VCBS repeat-containing protein [Gemmatimonadales bacterium]|nr:VCBS repeat-containing protein [Gemmatimonadales bacterium]